MPSAFFVKHPSRAEQLCRPHLPEWEQSYTVAAELTLEEDEYRNLCCDLAADRAYLERFLPLCGGEGTLRCLLIRPARRGRALLIVPEEGGFISAAAILPEE